MSAVVQTGRRVASAVHGGEFWTGLLLTVGVPLLIPFAAIEAVGGTLVRTVYPGYVLLAASLLITRRRPLYPAFMLAIFAFSPFLRRVADLQAGFSAFNPILLAPYVGLLPTVPALVRRILGGAGSRHWPFAMLAACTAYASFLAMYGMMLVPSIYEAMRWLLPAALCAFIMAEPHQAEAVHSAIIRALCLIVPVVTVYGIYQFVVAPRWDVFWMVNIDNATFGFPEPFRIRVFSTLNSPGTAGVFCSYAMILLAGEGLGALAIAASGLPLLALTLIRTAWISVAVGLFVLMLRAKGTRRLVIVAGSLSIAFVAAAVLDSSALPLEVRDLIIERIGTFSSGSSDASAADRLAVYDAFFERLAKSPWGEGFGANASTATVLSGRHDQVSIDSGIMEPYLTFGILVGTLYFIALAALVVTAGRAVRGTGQRLNGAYALIWAVITILPLGSVETAEVGVVLWSAVGCLFARADAIERGLRINAIDRGRRSVPWPTA